MENMMLLDQQRERAYRIEDIKKIYIEYELYKYDLGFLPDNMIKPYKLYIAINNQNIQNMVIVGEYKLLSRAKQALEEILDDIAKNLYHVKVLKDEEKD